MAARPTILKRPSPNYGPRRHALRPILIVLHYTAMETSEAALDRLIDPKAEVSAHYLICEDGIVYQMVDETMRAWHAGAGSWQGMGDINSRSIGIELCNRGDHPFAESQMAALCSLLPEIMTRWSILPSGVIAHSDVAPTRKIDPGPKFDWQRLAIQGLTVWPDEESGYDTDLQCWAQHAAAIGYDMAEPDAVLAAFRARFRPWAKGPLDDEDVRRSERLKKSCMI